MNSYSKTQPTSTSSDQSTSSSAQLKLTFKQHNLVSELAKADTALVVAPTGAGKTAIMLHTIQEKQQKTIIACPPMVMSVWPKEVTKWGMDLQVTLLTGTPEQRLKALKIKSDILVVSLNNLNWLLKQNHQATAIVIDEISKGTGKQTQQLKNKISDPLTTRIGMTATPVSENYEKLYGIFRILDKGKTFGRSKDSFMNKYFTPMDFKGYRWELRPGAQAQLMSLITPYTFFLDYVKAQQLPPMEEEELVFDLPAKTRKLYEQMKADLMLDLEEAAVISPNLAVLTSKLRQICSGFSIDERQQVVEYDTERAKTAQLWVDSLEGHPGLIIYEYDHQRVQLERLLLNSVSLYGGSKKEQVLQAFKTGQRQILIAQKNTLSHGVDGLQHVCADLLFYQPIWSADSTEQAIGRVWRQGQTQPVTITYLIADQTIDDLVMVRVDGKAINMKTFMEYLHAN